MRAIPNLLNLLFGFSGRIRRLHYWLTAVGVSLASSMMLTPLLGVSGLAEGSPSPLPMIAIAALLFLDAWIGLAVGIKRCHDRDKPGVFVLVGFIPLIGGLWLLIELGFLDGTPGPNKFGPSPKAATQPVPT